MRSRTRKRALSGHTFQRDTEFDVTPTWFQKVNLLLIRNRHQFKRTDLVRWSQTGSGFRGKWGYTITFTTLILLFQVMHNIVPVHASKHKKGLLESLKVTILQLLVLKLVSLITRPAS